MEYAKVIEHEMNEFEQSDADELYQAIQNASNGTERSAQQQANVLGMSNIGHCRQYAVLMTRQTEPTDVRDKTAAFIGTVLGQAIEAQMKLEHPDWLFQTEGVFKIPSGGELGTHPDVVIPASAAVSVEEFLASYEARQAALERIDAGEANVSVPPKVFVQGVRDLKSKDKLDTIKKYGPSQQQRYQLHGYASSMIDAGVLDGDKPIWLSDIYFDRSGSQHEAYTFGEWYDPAVLEEIDDWIHDVKYAVINGIDASRDKSREWCWSWCEYATMCRGNDTDVEGLIEDPGTLAAIHNYAKGLGLVAEGETLKKNAKLSIPAHVSGSTGTHKVRWVEYGPTEVKAGVRAGYRKLSITPVTAPKPKPKAAPRKKKKEEQASE